MKNNILHSKIMLIMATLLFLAINSVHANNCGNPFSNHFGPFDYNDPKVRELGHAGSKKHSKLSIVENAHFTSYIETLERGRTALSPLLDIDYTLKAFPNHPRALASIAKFQRLNGVKLFKKKGVYDADCFFDRAIRFKPKDPVVRMIYGIHLHLTGKYDEALVQYKQSESIYSDSSDLQYNMGLLYIKLGDPESALVHAKKAYKLKHPLPGLKRKLKGMNYWP